MNVRDSDPIREVIDKIEPAHAIGLNESLEEIFNLPVGELFQQISNFKDTKFLVIDGILSNRLLSLLLNLKIKFIACKNKEEDLYIPEQISFFYFYFFFLIFLIYTYIYW